MSIILNNKYYLLTPKGEDFEDAIETTFLCLHDVDLPKTLKEVKEHNESFNGDTDLYKITIEVEKIRRNKK